MLKVKIMYDDILGNKEDKDDIKVLTIMDDSEKNKKAIDKASKDWLKKNGLKY